MESLKPAFIRASVQITGFSIFWMLVWAVAIDDDRQRHEKDGRRKWQAYTQRQRKRTCPIGSPAGPRPF